MHQICEHLGVDSSVVGSIVARSAESMWNPIYGTRGGAPYGGACLPKDTEAFFAFCEAQGLSHKMLEATIAVNEDLLASRPAAESPEEIDRVLAIANGEIVGEPLTFSTNGFSKEHNVQILATMPADNFSI